MGAGLSKESRQLRAKVERLPGWEVDHTKKRHLRYRAPDGDVYITSFTPSDYRGIRNLRAWLRRKGCDV